MSKVSELESRVFDSVRSVVEQLERISARRDSFSVTICGVTKGRSIQEIAAFANAMRVLSQPVVIAESYVKELSTKEAGIKSLAPPELHFIGPLQSNKVDALVGNVDVIQSLSSLKLLGRIQARARQLEVKQGVYLQCNISGDEAKKGFAPEDVLDVVKQVHLCESVELKGLMTITRFYDEPQDVRPDYRRMFALHQEACSALLALGRDLNKEPLALSMGMSQDYQIAAEEGATMVRIGSLFFG